jgi:ribonuclease HII
VACALCFNTKNKPNKNFLEKLNDSKKLNVKKRDGLYVELIKMANLETPQVFF